MPDDKQAIIDELDRRGVFKDPEKRAIAEELANRHVIHLPASLMKGAASAGQSRSKPTEAAKGTAVPQRQAQGPQSSVEAQARQMLEQRRLANAQAEKGPLGPIHFATAPLDTLLGKVGHFIAQHTQVPAFGQVPVPYQPAQKLSPLQAEIDRQRSHMLPGEQIKTRDPQGPIAETMPGLIEYAHSPSKSNQEAVAKGLIRGGMELATLDNAAIGALLGPLGQGGKLGKYLQKAITGGFGAEAAKSAAESWGRYKKSGYKDKDALVDVAKDAGFAGLMAGHVTGADKLIGKAVKSRLERKAPLAEAAKKDPLVSREKAEALKPKVEPKKTEAAPERKAQVARRAAARTPGAKGDPFADKPEKKAPTSHAQPSERKGEANIPPKEKAVEKKAIRPQAPAAPEPAKATPAPAARAKKQAAPPAVVEPVPEKKPTTKSSVGTEVKTDAAKEGLLKQDTAVQHQGDDKGRARPEASRGRVVQPAKEVQGQEVKPQRGTAASLKKTAEAPKGPARISAEEANLLGLHHDPGNVFGDKLTQATKPMDLTAEQANAMRRLVDEKRLNRKQLAGLYKEDAKSAALRAKGEQALHSGLPLTQFIQPFVDAARSVQHLTHGGRFREANAVEPKISEQLHRLKSAPAAGRYYGVESERDMLRGLSKDQIDTLGKLITSANIEAANPEHAQVIPQDAWVEAAQDPAVYNALLKFKDIAAKIEAYRTQASPNMKLRNIPGGLFRSLENAAIEPTKGGGRGGTIAGQVRVRGTRFARERTGKAEEYRTDIRGYAERMFGEVAEKAEMRKLYNDLKTTTDSAGNPIGIETGPKMAAPQTMEYNGKEYPVRAETFLFKLPNGLDDNRTIYMPEPVWKDVRDALVKPAAPSDLQKIGRGFQGAIVATNLLAPQEVLRHMSRVNAIVSHVPDLGASPLRRLGDIVGGAATGGVSTKIGRLWDIANNDMSHPVNRQIADDLMKAGGGSGRAFSSYIAEGIPGIRDIQHFTHDTLFGIPEGKGLKGFDMRARVYMEKMRRAVEEPNGEPADPKRMREFANQLGQYMTPDHITQWARAFNPYAGTQLPMRVTEMRHLVGDAGFDTSKLTTGQKVALRAETLFRGTLAVGGTMMALNYALTKHWPWQNDDGHQMQLDTGKKDKDGAKIYVDVLNMPFLGDPALARGLRSTGFKSIASAYVHKSPLTGAQSLLADYTNDWILEPLRNPAADTLTTAGFGSVLYIGYDRQGNPSAWLPVAKKVTSPKGEKSILLNYVPAEVRPFLKKSKAPSREQKAGEQMKLNVLAALENMNPIAGDIATTIPGVPEARYMREKNTLKDKGTKTMQYLLEDVFGQVVRKGTPPKQKENPEVKKILRGALSGR